VLEISPARRTAPVLERRKDLMRKHGLPDGHVPKIALVLAYPSVPFRKAIRRSFLSVRNA